MASFPSEDDADSDKENPPAAGKRERLSGGGGAGLWRSTHLSSGGAGAFGTQLPSRLLAAQAVRGGPPGGAAGGHQVPLPVRALALRVAHTPC